MNRYGLLYCVPLHSYMVIEESRNGVCRLEIGPQDKLIKTVTGLKRSSRSLAKLLRISQWLRCVRSQEMPNFPLDILSAPQFEQRVENIMDIEFHVCTGVADTPEDSCWSQ
eukprot:Gregarina_sp_Poly_1__10815@NODE_834_length_6076_cov_122_476286_g602_i0_p6_GENE_NODE_834_length_6076_cov_122_476286_g602_i0NODE_834_length_6076_cov_122_476286_g602_i0_p6_ORF_typecomplete_len111_score11_09_NODE_834_length_6076_cov_122_476286_g602_i029263258